MIDLLFKNGKAVCEECTTFSKELLSEIDIKENINKNSINGANNVKYYSTYTNNILYTMYI